MLVSGCDYADCAAHKDIACDSSGSDMQMHDAILQVQACGYFAAVLLHALSIIHLALASHCCCCDFK